MITRDRTLLVWAILVLATLASWTIGDDHLTHRQNVVAPTVIAIAFIKVRFVGLQFMELREAPLLLRAAFEAYVAVAALVLIVLYLAY
ncbi:MAG TPA: cytochrome C oxidase subunit IV family protein [Sporichthyaceae bacterium]|nr:cytochrome C oxidase subunit IV family protein [Sporichthyaceae bacterium]